MAGKIFKKDEAENLFGKVIESVTMDINVFNSLMSMTENNIMFRLLNGALTILDDNRKVIHPNSSTAIAPEEVFGRASKSVVAELLNLSKDAEIIVEKREKHITVTYGDCTLEEVSDCPPYCY